MSAEEPSTTYSSTPTATTVTESERQEKVSSSRRKFGQINRKKRLVPIAILAALVVAIPVGINYWRYASSMSPQTTPI